MDSMVKSASAGPTLLTPGVGREWGLLLLGLVALFGPTLFDLFRGPWGTEEQAHGPVILALSLWLIYRGWPDMMARTDSRPALLGWAVFVLGLLSYVLGRSQQIPLFELGALVWILAGILLLKRGTLGFRILWFPFLFMLFMIPLPGALVSMLTMPMKMAVSYVVEHVLFWCGYPIARTGVILQIGAYQLLVADACAGLQTFLTLESLGLFYLNVVRHTSALRNIGIALLIIPISFTANVIRVISLTLITYYFGDAAGQGFLHGFAGMVLFITALILILGMDSGLQWLVKRRERKAQGEGVSS